MLISKKMADGEYTSFDKSWLQDSREEKGIVSISQPLEARIVTSLTKNS